MMAGTSKLRTVIGPTAVAGTSKLEHVYRPNGFGRYGPKLADTSKLRTFIGQTVLADKFSIGQSRLAETGRYVQIENVYRPNGFGRYGPINILSATHPPLYRGGGWAADIYGRAVA